MFDFIRFDKFEYKIWIFLKIGYVLAQSKLFYMNWTVLFKLDMKWPTFLEYKTLMNSTAKTLRDSGLTKINEMHPEYLTIAI